VARAEPSRARSRASARRPSSQCTSTAREAQLVPGRHRRPRDPAAGAARHGRAGRRDRRGGARQPLDLRLAPARDRRSDQARRTRSRPNRALLLAEGGVQQAADEGGVVLRCSPRPPRPGSGCTRRVRWRRCGFAPPGVFVGAGERRCGRSAVSAGRGSRPVAMADATWLGDSSFPRRSPFSVGRRRCCSTRTSPCCRRPSARRCSRTPWTSA